MTSLIVLSLPLHPFVHFELALRLSIQGRHWLWDEGNRNQGRSWALIGPRELSCPSSAQLQRISRSPHKSCSLPQMLCCHWLLFCTGASVAGLVFMTLEAGLWCWSVHTFWSYLWLLPAPLPLEGSANSVNCTHALVIGADLMWASTVICSPIHPLNWVTSPAGTSSSSQSSLKYIHAFNHSLLHLKQKLDLDFRWTS